MVRQVSDKGFTLIETLIVLSVLTICMLVSPILKQHTVIAFSYEMQEIRFKLMNAQQTAIREKRNVFVDFLGNAMQIDNQTTNLSNHTSCNAKKFHFTPIGNVSNAMSITCLKKQDKKQIVVQLGTGRMYVK